MIVHTLSAIPGTVEFFMGSIVCYHSSVKIDVLGIPESLIKKYTAKLPEITGRLLKII